MTDLPISSDLVGQRVCNPVRPEWGVGTVLRVQSTTLGGQPSHRVSVQFASGHRTLVIPPGRLSEPREGPRRESSWIDRVGKHTLDDRLIELPEQVREFLGTSAQRLVVLARLYELDDDGPALLRWARSQTGVADPLSQWSRDEIRASFAEFCRRRDRILRDAVARLRSTGGERAVNEAMAEVSGLARDRMLALIR